MNFPLEKRTVSKTLQLHGGQMKKETFESDEVNNLHGRILKPVVYKLGENHGKKSWRLVWLEISLFASFLLRRKRIILKMHLQGRRLFELCSYPFSNQKSLKGLGGGEGLGACSEGLEIECQFLRFSAEILKKKMQSKIH